MTGVCSVGRADVSSFRADVSSFWPNVFSFEGNVSTLAGDVSSFRRGAWVGAGAAVGAGAVAGRDGGGAEIFAGSGEWGQRIAVAGVDPGVQELRVPRAAGALADFRTADRRGQSRDQGAVLLAVRPVWGGASTGAKGVDSVPDYVVRSWDPKTAVRASDWIRGVAWVGLRDGIVRAAEGFFSGRGERQAEGDTSRWPTRTSVARR